MSYQPSSEVCITRHWFTREPVTTKDTHQHLAFPVIDSDGEPICLCRSCTPAADADHEEKIQTVYVKAIEHFLEEHGLHINA
jgi:hypothetical protein